MTVITEGLRPNDLQDMIFDIFEVDTFQSKMGEDRDVCVLSFRARDRAPARDMMEFIEKGYNFVLDSDVSAGEDREGTYHVFVELNRSPELGKQIAEIVEGIKRLTAIEGWKFRYHKSSYAHELSEDNINKIIPTSPNAYETMMESKRVDGIQKFFSKTYKNDMVVEGNKITINRPFGMKLSFDIVTFGNIDEVQKNLSETIKVDTKSMAEVMWLTKMLGDYNINKYGDHFVLEDGKKTMIIKMEN
jgi:hypothetical protein